MPVYQALEHPLQMKALAWNFQKQMFVSPARPDFEWGPGGLTASACGRGHSHRVPDPKCSCGLYGSWKVNIVEEYIYESIYSPIFLVEGSGRIVYHRDGYRSEEMTIRYVLQPEAFSGYEDVRLQAHMAADYFRIPLIEQASGILIMDLWNTLLKSWYTPQSSALRSRSREEILDMARMYFTEESAAKWQS